MRRLAIAIHAWQNCLLGVNADSTVDTMDTTSAPQPAHKLGGTPALLVSIFMYNIIMYICKYFRFVAIRCLYMYS